MADKLAAQKQHGEILKNLKVEFANLQDSAKGTFSDIIADADRVFERYSRPVPEALDGNAIELLRSGILSDDELLSTAADFEGNLTMRRALAPFLKSRARITTDTVASHRLSTLVVECESANFDYKTPLEQFSQLAIEALHYDATRAAAYAKALEEKYPQLCEEAKNLSAVVEGERDE